MEMISHQVSYLRKLVLGNLVVVGLRSIFQLALFMTHGNRFSIVPIASVFHPLVLKNQGILHGLEREAIRILTKVEIKRQCRGFLPPVMKETIRLACYVTLRSFG